MNITQDSKIDMSDLQTKMKILQKHQVFEAEILAHGNIIESVQQVNRCTKVTSWLSCQLEIILFICSSFGQYKYI